MGGKILRASASPSPSPSPSGFGFLHNGSELIEVIKVAERIKSSLRTVFVFVKTAVIEAKGFLGLLVGNEFSLKRVRVLAVGNLINRMQAIMITIYRGFLMMISPALLAPTQDCEYCKQLKKLHFASPLGVMTLKLTWLAYSLKDGSILVSNVIDTRSEAMVSGAS